MFGIALNSKNFQVSTCTAEQLDKALRSPVVAKACATIEDALEQCRRGEMDRKEFDAIKSRCKLQLPVLTPHAIFTHNRRKAEQAIPSGFSMYDIDHISNPPGPMERNRLTRQRTGHLLGPHHPLHRGTSTHLRDATGHVVRTVTALDVAAAGRYHL